MMHTFDYAFFTGEMEVYVCCNCYAVYGIGKNYGRTIYDNPLIAILNTGRTPECEQGAVFIKQDIVVFRNFKTQELCPKAYDNTSGQYFCTREAEHDGPCAAVRAR